MGAPKREKGCLPRFGGCKADALRDALDGAGSPRLVLVREPDQLGVERAHPQLAFGARLVELAKLLALPPNMCLKLTARLLKDVHVS